jgi:ATP-dependent Lhr-like helicase
VLTDGQLVAFVERGARSVLSWETDTPVLANGLMEVAKQRSGTTTIGKINGEPVLASPFTAPLLAAGFATGYKGLTYRNRR